MGSDDPKFLIVLRGYDRDEVDAFVAQIAAGTAVEARPSFSIRLRGYERRQVERYVASVTL
jgi:DivIVA domain-containing protein